MIIWKDVYGEVVHTTVGRLPEKTWFGNFLSKDEDNDYVTLGVPSISMFQWVIRGYGKTPALVLHRPEKKLAPFWPEKQPLSPEDAQTFLVELDKRWFSASVAGVISRLKLIHQKTPLFSSWLAVFDGLKNLQPHADWRFLQRLPGGFVSAKITSYDQLSQYWQLSAHDLDQQSLLSVPAPDKRYDVDSLSALKDWLMTTPCQSPTSFLDLEIIDTERFIPIGGWPSSLTPDYLCRWGQQTSFAAWAKLTQTDALWRSTEIPGTIRWIDPWQMEQRMSRASPEIKDKLKVHYDTISETGMSRPLQSINKDRFNALLQLDEDFPHFQKVTHAIRKEIALLLLSGDSPSLNLPPMLLAGGAGIGKTHYLHRLGQILQVPHPLLAMGTASGEFLLSGLSLSYHGGQPGRLVSSLLESPYLNALLILDEIDKTPSTENGSALNALYSLLEPDTAQKFRDEALLIDMDLRPVMIMATANDLSVIPEAILDRFKVFDVTLPQKMLPKVATSVYRQWRINACGGARIAESPSAAIIKQMAKSTNLRDMRIRLAGAAGQAALRVMDTFVADVTIHLAETDFDQE